MKITSLVFLAVVGLAHAATRTSPPSGCDSVATDGSGDYSSIQDAVDSGSTCIFIYPGTYNEQVYITTSGLTIYGSTSDTTSYSSNTVTITQGKSQDDGIGNDETATIRAHGANFKLYNVNVKNSRGKGSQAVALSAYADAQGYYGVQLIGYQDTLLSQTGNHLFASSYIEGRTDFIFGQQARAWFEGVTINAIDAGYITANGRDSDDNVSYYLFNNCNIAGDASSGTVYLGRPWRAYSRVVYQNSKMSSVINSAGWVVWSSSDERTSNVYYMEYGNSGDGAATSSRASFAGTMSAAVSMTDILGSSYTSWVDSDYI